MRRATRGALVSIAVAAAGSTATANYYVKAVGGSNGASGLDTSSAFATIQRAADTAGPGDTVFVMNGTYTNPPVGGEASPPP